MFKQFCPLSYLTKKRAQLVITMFLITFVAFMWVELASTKPIYNGKPIDYWITHPQTAKPFASYGAKRFSPDEVYFPKVDSKAVPFLIRALMRKDGRFDKAYRNVFNKLPFAIRGRLPIPKQPTDYELIRLVAIEVLRRMGPEAKPAIPTLAHILKSDESDFVRMYAADLLSRFVKSDTIASKALEGARNDKEEAVRIIAAEALDQMVPDGLRLFGQLQASINNKHEATLRETDRTSKKRWIKAVFPETKTVGYCPRISSHAIF